MAEPQQQQRHSNVPPPASSTAIQSLPKVLGALAQYDSLIRWSSPQKISVRMLRTIKSVVYVSSHNMSAIRQPSCLVDISFVPVSCQWLRFLIVSRYKTELIALRFLETLLLFSVKSVRLYRSMVAQKLYMPGVSIRASH